jgi:hypothetical protein
LRVHHRNAHLHQVARSEELTLGPTQGRSDQRLERLTEDISFGGNYRQALELADGEGHTDLVQDQLALLGPLLAAGPRQSFTGSPQQFHHPFLHYGRRLPPQEVEPARHPCPKLLFVEGLGVEELYHLADDRIVSRDPFGISSDVVPDIRHLREDRRRGAEVRPLRWEQRQIEVVKAVGRGPAKARGRVHQESSEGISTEAM